MVSPSPDRAARIEAELAAREIRLLEELAIRPDGLAEFVQLLWSVVEPRRPLVWGWHMDAICRLLMDSYAGELEARAAVINVPPRHSKSTLVAVLGPAWRWLHAPETQFLCITKAEKNAARDARLMRRVIQSPQYQRLLALKGEGWQLSDDQNRVHYYANTEGGHRISLTTTSDVTGAGATFLIIDDPHDASDLLGSPEQVARRLEETWGRYEEVWTRRLNPGGRVQVIMQRLHEGDLAGRLLAGDAARLVLPFSYEADHPDLWDEDPRAEGDRLAPGRFTDQDEVDGRKNPMVWAGQMQQRPAPREGGLFKAAWFERTWTTLPTLAQIVLSIDASFKGGRKHDPCGFGTFGRGSDDAARYVLDIQTERLDYPGLKRAVRLAALELRARFVGVPVIILVEDKANGSALIDDLKGEISGVVPFEPGNKSKFERAQVSSVPVLEAGQLLLPERAVWKRAYISGHTSFPNAAHDEEVDITSQALAYMATHPLQHGGIRTGGTRRNLSERGEGDGWQERADRDGGRRRRGGRRGGW